jgi:hypothetical protein
VTMGRERGLVWCEKRGDMGDEGVDRMDFGICAAEEMAEYAAHLNIAVRQAVRQTGLATCQLFGYHGDCIDNSLKRHYTC